MLPLRQGAYKLITFGHSFDAFSEARGYVPQLFDVDADPDEVADLAAARPDVVAALDALLRAELDCAAVDAEVKASDQQLFLDYFGDDDDATLSATLAKVDRHVVCGGFDDHRTGVSPAPSQHFFKTEFCDVLTKLIEGFQTFPAGYIFSFFTRIRI